VQPPPTVNRSQVKATLPNDDELQTYAKKVLGRPIAPTLQSMSMLWMMSVMAPCLDVLFLNKLSSSLSRQRVFFSDDELTAIKAAATKSEGWVTTQEALTAYMLSVLAKHLVPKRPKHKAAVIFLLDARRCLGMPANQLLGNGMNFMKVEVCDVLQKSLSDLAYELHDALTSGMASPEMQRDQWQLQCGACERGMDFEVMKDLMKTSAYDIFFAINNQSKRQLPDFGGAGGKGRVSTFISNAGPNLWVPARGGLEVHLGSELFTSAGYSSNSPAAQKAISALRAELPNSEQKPRLLGTTFCEDRMGLKQPLLS